MYIEKNFFLCFMTDVYMCKNAVQNTKNYILVKDVLLHISFKVAQVGRYKFLLSIIWCSVFMITGNW